MAKSIIKELIIVLLLCLAIILVLGILLYGLSELKLLTFANAIYFLAGVAIRQSESNIIRILSRTCCRRIRMPG